tara:strand:+ start:377 stop:568 length:192 start_codon:yes stop_codon:yes gene_type:complete
MKATKKMPGGGHMKKPMMPGGGTMKKPMYMYGGKVYAKQGTMLKAILQDPKQAALARQELGMK